MAPVNQALSAALPVVLDAIAACPHRDELRTLLDAVDPFERGMAHPPHEAGFLLHAPAAPVLQEGDG